MKICFWGSCSGALANNPSGGGEMQIALLAKALVRAGNEVVLVDYSISENFETPEGIKVFCIKGYDNGIRFFRAFKRHFKLIYTSLRDQKADVYYCRIRDFRHIITYWAARKVKAKFILGLASDVDLLGVRARLKYLYSSGEHSLWSFFSGILTEIVYPWLLRNSDLILVQHEGQKDVLDKKHIKCKILKNLIDLNEIPVVINPIRKDFIYVGALRKRKGFLEFFELIEKDRMHSFKIIGEARDKVGLFYYNKLKSFENVTLFGRLTHTETLYQMTNSKALISTSPMEGFPNIFIEAWACGIPVISLSVDPGNIIKKEKLGVMADGDMEKILHGMAAIEVTEEMNNRLKSYVERNHVLNDIKVNEINNIFLAVQKKDTPGAIKRDLQ